MKRHRNLELSNYVEQEISIIKQYSLYVADILSSGQFKYLSEEEKDNIDRTLSNHINNLDKIGLYVSKSMVKLLEDDNSYLLSDWQKITYYINIYHYYNHVLSMLQSKLIEEEEPDGDFTDVAMFCERLNSEGNKINYVSFPLIKKSDYFLPEDIGYIDFNEPISNLFKDERNNLIIDVIGDLLINNGIQLDDSSIGVYRFVDDYIVIYIYYETKTIVIPPDKSNYNNSVVKVLDGIVSLEKFYNGFSSILNDYDYRDFIFYKLDSEEFEIYFKNYLFDNDFYEKKPRFLNKGKYFNLNIEELYKKGFIPVEAFKNKENRESFAKSYNKNVTKDFKVPECWENLIKNLNGDIKENKSYYPLELMFSLIEEQREEDTLYLLKKLRDTGLLYQTDLCDEESYKYWLEDISERSLIETMDILQTYEKVSLSKKDYDILREYESKNIEIPKSIIELKKILGIKNYTNYYEPSYLLELIDNL